MGGRRSILVALLPHLLLSATGFCPHNHHWRHPFQRRTRSVALHAGSGEVSGRYWWTENDEELEVRVAVPAGTKAGEVQFKLTQKTLCLKLSSSEEALLDGELRGKVTTDGSYWSIETLDAADSPASAADEQQQQQQQKQQQPTRVVVLRLEKKPDGMYDPEEWQGVLLDACEQDATLNYDIDPKEEFDVQEYIDSLGGYDESLVDKTMFSGVAKGIFDDMVQNGLVKDSIAGPDEEDEEDDEEDGAQEAEVVATGSSFSELMQGMTVKELKAELRDRGLKVTGVKAELAGRLSAAMQAEEYSAACAAAAAAAAAGGEGGEENTVKFE
jgi:hypothetical protein